MILLRGGNLLTDEACEALKAGDLIEYEPFTQQAIRVAHPAVKIKDFLGETPDVNWSDIGGLDDVRGVGPSRKKALMTRFGSMKRMREAEVEELAEVVPDDVAHRLHAALRGRDVDRIRDAAR